MLKLSFMIVDDAFDTPVEHTATPVEHTATCSIDNNIIVAIFLHI